MTFRILNLMYCIQDYYCIRVSSFDLFRILRATQNSPKQPK